VPYPQAISIALVYQGLLRNLNFLNRPVRTRMPGGVGGVRRGKSRRPYPDRNGQAGNTGPTCPRVAVRTGDLDNRSSPKSTCRLTAIPSAWRRASASRQTLNAPRSLALLSNAKVGSIGTYKKARASCAVERHCFAGHVANDRVIQNQVARPTVSASTE